MEAPARSVNWQKGIRYVWIGTLVVVLAGFMPWAVYELHSRGTETHVQAWFVAGVFVCLAIPMTVWDVAQHLTHWNNPKLQVCHVCMVVL